MYAIREMLAQQVKFCASRQNAYVSSNPRTAREALDLEPLSSILALDSALLVCYFGEKSFCFGT